MLNESESYVAENGLVKDFGERSGGGAGATFCIDTAALTASVRTEIEAHPIFDARTMSASEIYKNVIVNIQKDAPPPAAASSAGAGAPAAAPIVFDTGRQRVRCAACSFDYIVFSSVEKESDACPRCGCAPRSSVFFGDGFAHRVDEAPTWSNQMYLPSAADASFNEKAASAIHEVVSGKFFLTNDDVEAATRILRKKPTRLKQLLDPNQVAGAIFVAITEDIAQTKRVAAAPMRVPKFACERCSEKHHDWKSARFCCRRVGEKRRVGGKGMVGEDVFLVPVTRRRRTF